MAKKVNAVTLAEMRRKGADVMLKELEQQVVAQNGLSIGKDSTQEKAKKLIGDAILKQHAAKEQKVEATSVGEPAKVKPVGPTYGIAPEVSSHAAGLQGKINEKTPEQKAKEAEEAYRQQQAQLQADEALRKKDMDEYATWSPEEQRSLEQYVLDRDAQRAGWVTDQFMTAPETNAKALIDKYGLDRVKEMAESYTRTKNKEVSEDVAKKAQEGASKSGWAAAGHSMASVGANLLDTTTGTIGYVNEMFDRTGRYSTLDPNNTGKMFSTYAGNVRGTVSGMIAGDEYDENGQLVKEGGKLREGLSLAYQGGMSAADSVARILASGSNAGVSAALAASGAFSQTVQEASRQGATPGQAAALGVTKAGIEYMTEKLPTEKVLQLFKGANDVGKVAAVLQQAFLVEPTSEEVSLFAGVAAEAMILKDKSNQKLQIGEMVANGMSYEEAQKAFYKELWNEAAQTYVTSMFSGLFSSGGAAILGGNNNVVTPEQMPVEAAPAADSGQQIIQDTAAELAQNAPQQAAEPMTDGQREVMAAMDGVLGVDKAAQEAQQAEQAQKAVQPDEQNAGIKGTGAAEANFSDKPAYNATLAEDNAQADRADDVRPMELPARDINGENVSQVTGNTYASKITPDEFASLMEEPTARGDFSYAKITNDQATQRATETIASAGNWNQAYDNWKRDVAAGKAGAEMSARGALMLNYAAQQGNKQQWLETLHYMQELGTNTAQGLQAFRIIRTLNATDKIAFLQMSINKMAASIKSKYGVDIEVDNKLIEAYDNATTDEARNEALTNVQKNIADQIPSTFLDKWTALRYMNMLGNLKTNVRNVAGNVGSAIVYRAKDTVATGMETLADWLSGGKVEKTKSLFVNKDLLNACKQDFDQFTNTVSNGGKYGDRMTAADSFEQGVMDKKTVFKSNAKDPTAKAIGDAVMKPLEMYRKGTNWMMNNKYFGDEAFSRAGYSRALAGYLQANGVTSADLSKVDGALLDKARAYAIKEAQEATFHDNSKLAQIAGDIKKATGVVGEGIVPFTKTPANVLTRAVEFSPVGLLDSTVKSIQAATGKGEVTGADVINSWAKTFTGTALFALGALMYDQGLLTGGPDEDEEKAEFDKLNGGQNYALQFRNGFNYTIDWLTPAAMPAFMGAQFWKEFSKDRELTFADAEKVFTAIADPMIQMSMLQSLNDTLDSVKYVDNNFGQILINSAVSYLTQGLTNTLVGQIERSTEQNRQTTYVDKDSQMPKWMQQTLGKASQKIPGWDFQQIDYRNAWGQTEENEGGLVYNLLSPGYLSKEESNAISQELYRLREATGANVFPQAAAKTVSFTDKNGVLHKDYNLSAEQLQTMQQTQGETAAKVISAMISSADYAALTDEQKAEAINTAYTYAKEKAEIAAVPDHLGYSNAWMKAMPKGAEASTIVAKTATASLDNAVAGLKTAWKNGWSDAEDADKLQWAYDAFEGLKKTTKADVLEQADTMTANYLEARSEGVSHEEFLDVSKLLADINPPRGYSEARNYQIAETISGAKNLDEAEKVLLMKQQLTDAQDQNLDDMRKLGYDTGRYAEVLKLYRRIYDSDNIEKKKDAFVEALMKQYKLSEKDANKIYQVYKNS